MILFWEKNVISISLVWLCFSDSSWDDENVWWKKKIYFSNRQQKFDPNFEVMFFCWHFSLFVWSRPRAHFVKLNHPWSRREQASTIKRFQDYHQVHRVDHSSLRCRNKSTGRKNDEVSSTISCRIIAHRSFDWSRVNSTMTFPSSYPTSSSTSQSLPSSQASPRSKEVAPFQVNRRKSCQFSQANERRAAG